MSDRLLTLQKSAYIEDWWLIEWAEHEGVQKLVPTEYGASLWCSSRPSDADIEGTADEMLGIASAIEARSSFSARRCSVACSGETALFDSPRNSQRPGVVSLAVADLLAKEIREKLGREE